VVRVRFFFQFKASIIIIIVFMIIVIISIRFKRVSIMISQFIITHIIIILTLSWIINLKDQYFMHYYFIVVVNYIMADKFVSAIIKIVVYLMKFCIAANCFN